MASGDPAVEVDYAIKMTGFGDVPAMGSADAYINAHIPRSPDRPTAKRAEGPELLPSKSTAAGDITLFQKVIAYQSGLRRF